MPLTNPFWDKHPFRPFVTEKLSSVITICLTLPSPGVASGQPITVSNLRYWGAAGVLYGLPYQEEDAQ